MIHWKKKFSTTPNRGTLQPKVQPLIIYHGCITCQICFVSSDKRNIKRGSFQEVTELCQFKEVAEAWEKVDHEYNKINQMVDWQDFAEKWAQNTCKGKFFKKRIPCKPNAICQHKPITLRKRSTKQLISV